jgi:hypothetical protein
VGPLTLTALAAAATPDVTAEGLQLALQGGEYGVFIGGLLLLIERILDKLRLVDVLPENIRAVFVTILSGVGAVSAALFMAEPVSIVLNAALVGLVIPLVGYFVPSIKR